MSEQRSKKCGYGKTNNNHMTTAVTTTMAVKTTIVSATKKNKYKCIQKLEAARADHEHMQLDVARNTARARCCDSRNTIRLVIKMEWRKAK